MEYLYGDFSDKQIANAKHTMHNEIHKLLLYKDKRIKNTFFSNEEEFKKYFRNLLFRYGGLNELLGEPNTMIPFMSTMQAAYSLAKSNHFDYRVFRRAILDSHDYIESIFKEVEANAKFSDSEKTSQYQTE